MATQLNATEARQATKRPRAMIWVLVISLMLCLIAGLALGVGWISLPWGS
jgi:predicted Na+-dependent transporter